MVCKADIKCHALYSTFKGGLGIPQNGALGCQYHHEMLDNGNQGKRKEMLEIFKNYLRHFYPDWNENNLVYKNGKGELYEFKGN